MEIRLSDHVTYGNLLRFTAPSEVMMIFVSVYGVVDGVFASNSMGRTPVAAIHLIMPFLIRKSSGPILNRTSSAEYFAAERKPPVRPVVMLRTCSIETSLQNRRKDCMIFVE